jgi:hypothetical protein
VDTWGVGVYVGRGSGAGDGAEALQRKAIERAAGREGCQLPPGNMPLLGDMPAQASGASSNSGSIPVRLRPHLQDSPGDGIRGEEVCKHLGRVAQFVRLQPAAKSKGAGLT